MNRHAHKEDRCGDHVAPARQGPRFRYHETLPSTVTRRKISRRQSITLLIAVFAILFAGYLGVWTMCRVVMNAYQHGPARELREIVDLAVSAHFSATAPESGPPRFPATTDITPSLAEVRRHCRFGRASTFRTDPDQWVDDGWGELRFEIDVPQRYAFQFVSEGTGNDARFTALAYGDQDCDGVFEVWSRSCSARDGDVECQGLSITDEGE